MEKIRKKSYQRLKPQWPTLKISKNLLKYSYLNSFPKYLLYLEYSFYKLYFFLNVYYLYFFFPIKFTIFNSLLNVFNFLRMRVLRDTIAWKNNGTTVLLDISNFFQIHIIRIAFLNYRIQIRVSS